MKNNSFHFEGTYRVQSISTSFPAKLSGTWAASNRSCLTLANMNLYLANCANWMGQAKVSLRTASIAERTGAFASHADALYYHRLFTATDDSPGMECDILDLGKLMSLWTKRDHFLRAFFPAETYENLISKMGPLEQTAINEYMCHEAGHLLGFDIQTKWNGGYFRLGERVAWPLVYVEEFRADLESFGVALALLPPEEACAVFIYHVCHRFGLACESAQMDCENAGAVPYLLYHLLRELGAFRIKEQGRRKFVYLSDPTSKGIIGAMRACAAHATEFLTLPEVSAESQVDAALTGATYYRKRALDEKVLNEFWDLVRALDSKH